MTAPCCRVCGRLLSSPGSRAAGVGPVCAAATQPRTHPHATPHTTHRPAPAEQLALEEPVTDLTPTAVKLLREIADHDTEGSGVLFKRAPRARYEHPHTGSVFNRRTFFPLTGAGLVDDLGDDSAPVFITEAGRRWLAENKPRRGA